MSYAVKVENLHKSYGSNEILKGISFSVSHGEIFAVLGINGAGKTTTLEYEVSRQYRLPPEPCGHLSMHTALRLLSFYDFIEL